MTVAALGERQPSCRQTYEGDMFGFSCPIDHKINSVIAYYGQPKGNVYVIMKLLNSIVKLIIDVIAIAMVPIL